MVSYLQAFATGITQLVTQYIPSGQQPTIREQERAFPKLFRKDQTYLFFDEEIEEMAPIVREDVLRASPIPEETLREFTFLNKEGEDETLRISRSSKAKLVASYTKHEKTILQQQGEDGGGIAITAMLLLDQKKFFDLGQLESYQKSLEHCLLHHGIPFEKMQESEIFALQVHLAAGFAVVVNLGDARKPFFAIIDAVTEHSVRLRDPYHGWEITVQRAAFEKKWQDRAVFKTKMG